MILRKYSVKLAFLLLVCVVFRPGTFAQKTIEQYGVVDTIPLDLALFENEEAISIDLVFDIKDFLKTQAEDKYINAKFVCHQNDSICITKEVRLKARGNNRREVCKFPPLWINISEANFQSPQLENTKRIKLVTYCAKSRENNAYVLKEYLAYKIYNIISPYSFRVRLAKVNYIDTGRKNKEYEAWGFFIEPEEMMAQRLDAAPVKSDKIGYQATDPRQTDIMSMYQYIIGNADYSILSRQNLKLIMTNDPQNRKIIPVPYDFDYSGFVDASYAIPGETLGISSVTERYFLGPCRSDTIYKQIFDHFFAKKEDIYQLVRSFEHLDDNVRNSAIAYLDEFFEAATNEKYIKNFIEKTCREIQNQY